MDLDWMDEDTKLVAKEKVTTIFLSIIKLYRQQSTINNCVTGMLNKMFFRLMKWQKYET